jgi:hypothetical protein
MVDHISTEKGFMDYFVERRVDEEDFFKSSGPSDGLVADRKAFEKALQESGGDGRSAGLSGPEHVQDSADVAVV